MAKIEEILKTEDGRTAVADFNSIHMFLEGSFLRAYEMSAWLCHRFIHEFSPTHRTNKGLDKDIIFVGFPLTSLQKWTPNGSEWREVEEKHYVLLLRQELDDAGVEQLKDDFTRWKESVPMATSPSRKEDGKPHSSVGAIQPTDVQSFIRSIIEYPLERKNMLECVTFLSLLREQACDLFNISHK